MKNTINYQKGAASTAIIALIIFVVFLLAGAAVYYDSSREPLAVREEGVIPNFTNTNTNNNGEVVTSTTTLKTITVPARTVVRTTPASPFPGGAVYQSGVYSLTVNLPEAYKEYTVTVGKDAYTGVPNTASLHFSGRNGRNFTINVFTFEQWNKIRTIENAANMNVNSFGEGDYLGENFKYVYSSYGSEPQLQTILDQVRFY